jgi:hypothetical protein
MGRIKHVTTPVLECFKGEDGKKYHILFMLLVTILGLKCEATSQGRQILRASL